MQRPFSSLTLVTILEAPQPPQKTVVRPYSLQLIAQKAAAPSSVILWLACAFLTLSLFSPAAFSMPNSECSRVLTFKDHHGDRINYGRQLANYFRFITGTVVSIESRSAQEESTPPEVQGIVLYVNDLLDESYTVEILTSKGVEAISLNKIENIKILGAEKNPDMSSFMSVAATIEGPTLLLETMLPASTSPKYDLLMPLHYMYKGEETALFKPNKEIPKLPWGWKVKYFNDQELEAHRIIISEGVVYNSKGIRLNIPETKFIYIMDRYGNFYITDVDLPGRIQHSSLSRGLKVAGAGEILIENGVITKINRSAGHHRVEEVIFDTQVVKELQYRGISLKPGQIGASIFSTH